MPTHEANLGVSIVDVAVSVAFFIESASFIPIPNRHLAISRSSLSVSTLHTTVYLSCASSRIQGFVLKMAVRSAEASSPTPALVTCSQVLMAVKAIDDHQFDTRGINMPGLVEPYCTTAHRNQMNNIERCPPLIITGEHNRLNCSRLNRVRVQQIRAKQLGHHCISSDLFNDIVGRKVALLTSLAIFSAASLACALAQSLTQMHLCPCHGARVRDHSTAQLRRDLCDDQCGLRRGERDRTSHGRRDHDVLYMALVFLAQVGRSIPNQLKK
nr:hypothetical protein CFP56_26106 [Quercus suber]